MAANRQAAATEKALAAAQKQAEIAERQVTATNEQARIAQEQLAASWRPMLVGSVGTVNLKETQEGWMVSVAFYNIGPGPAFMRKGVLVRGAATLLSRLVFALLACLAARAEAFSCGRHLEVGHIKAVTPGSDTRVRTQGEEKLR